MLIVVLSVVVWLTLVMLAFPLGIIQNSVHGLPSLPNLATLDDRQQDDPLVSFVLLSATHLGVFVRPFFFKLLDSPADTQLMQHC